MKTFVTKRKVVRAVQVTEAWTRGEDLANLPPGVMINYHAGVLVAEGNDEWDGGWMVPPGYWLVYDGEDVVQCLSEEEFDDRYEEA